MGTVLADEALRTAQNLVFCAQKGRPRDVLFWRYRLVRTRELSTRLMVECAIKMRC